MGGKQTTCGAGSKKTEVQEIVNNKQSGGRKLLTKI